MSALMSLEDCLNQPLSSFEVAADGSRITFHPCGVTSHHPEDVRHRYCARCRRFIGDLLQTVELNQSA